MLSGILSQSLWRGNPASHPGMRGHEVTSDEVLQRNHTTRLFRVLQTVLRQQLRDEHRMVIVKLPTQHSDIPHAEPSGYEEL